MSELKMPKIGFGTFPLKGDELTNAVISALECGYRMFDTAHNYGNEEDLGNSLKIALRKTGIKREEIFVQTKIDEEGHGGKFEGVFYKKEKNECKDIFAVVKSQIEMSLRKIQVAYLDCVLIHWPYPDYFLEIWQALEIMHKQGTARNIGVSNCRERHLKKIMENCKIAPMANQSQFSPVNTMQSVADFCNKNKILLQTYSPIMLLRSKLKDNGVLLELSKKYNATVAQIVIKWNMQNGCIPLVKSSNPQRIKENITLDFEMEDCDMQKINSLNENYQGLPESIFCPGC